jgi:BirA family biotin operon repressor/biotin-[acetyl-CoA-carboxylase] ligase
VTRGESLRRIQARLIHATGAGGGSTRLAEAAAGVASGELEAALADLESGGVLEPCRDGVLRFGPRGSSLSAAEVEARLKTKRCGRPVEVHAVVGSTNDVVLERAVAGAPPGLCVAAELQTEGRGRRGRRFDSRPGLGVWSTTALDAPADPASAPRLSLVVAVAVAEAVEELGGARPALKWPNDVLLAGRKICGVLVEARSVGGRVHPVAGIGLNVHHRAEDFPPEFRDRAGGLEALCGRRQDRSRVLAALLGRLEAALDQDRAGRFDLPARFGPLDALRGRPVELREREQTRLGTARGIDADGRLLLEAGGRTVAVRGGEVTLRTPC